MAKSGSSTCFSACVFSELGLGFQSKGSASWVSRTGPWALRMNWGHGLQGKAHCPSSRGQTSWSSAGVQGCLLLELQSLGSGRLSSSPSPPKISFPVLPTPPPLCPPGVWPVGQHTTVPRKPDFHKQAVAGVGPQATCGGTRPPESPCGMPPSAPALKNQLSRGRLTEVCGEPSAKRELSLLDISVSRCVAFHVCPLTHFY